MYSRATSLDNENCIFNATWEPIENFIGEDALISIKKFLKNKRAKKKAKKGTDPNFVAEPDDEESERRQQRLKKDKLMTEKRRRLLRKRCPRVKPLKKQYPLIYSDDSNDEHHGKM